RCREDRQGLARHPRGASRGCRDQGPPASVHAHAATLTPRHDRPPTPMLTLGILIGVLLGLGIAVPVGWFEVKRQIRRARHAERRAQRAEQMAETGAMTGGLAHEIKNPLSTIGLNAQLLGEAIEEQTLPEAEKQRLKRRIDTLRREAERLRDT